MHKFFSISVFFFCVFSVLGSSANSTINVEKIREEGKKEGWGGFLSGRLALNSGNVDILRWGISTRVQNETFYQSTGSDAAWSKRLIFLVAGLDQGENSGKDYLNSGFSHLRWTQMWTKKMGTELFLQYEYDSFRLLNQRILLGLGGRLAAMKGEVDVTFGLGAFFESEKLKNETATTFLRGNSYFTLSGKPAKGVTISNTVYYQPRFGSWTDFKVLDQAELSFQMTRVIKFGLLFHLTHDSRPPANVEQTDIALENQLKFEF